MELSQEAGPISDLPDSKAFWATLVLCVVCVTTTVVALGVEWLSAPAWESPIGLFKWDVGGNPTFPIFLIEAAQIAALVWFKRGRVLFGLALAKVVVVLALTLLRVPAALAYVLLVLISLVAAAIGRRTLMLVGWRQTITVEDVLLSVSLGYGILGVVGLGFVLLHLLHLPIVVGFLVLVSFVLRAEFKQVLFGVIAGARSAWLAAREGDLRLPAVGLSIAVVSVLSSLIVALAEDVEYDSMIYHLAVPERYVAEGGMVDMPECIHAPYCHVAEMLFSLGLAVMGQPLPQLMHWGAGVLSVALLYFLAKHAAGGTVAWLAVLAYSLLPITTIQAGHAGADLFVTLFVLCAIHTFMIRIKSPEGAPLIVSGGFGGVALGAKLNALLFLAPLGILVFVRLWRDGGWRELWRRGVLQWGLVLCLVWSPWLLLEWTRTGNPVFPFCNSLFRSPLWTSPDSATHIDTLGLGHGLGSFLLLPWRLTAASGHFEPGTWGTLEGLPILCLPVTVLLWGSNIRRWLWVPGGVLLGGVMLWFSQVQCVRYLSPALPLMAMFVAVNAERCWSVFADRPWKKTVVSVSALGLALLLFQATRWYATKHSGHEGAYPWRLAFGLETPVAHLRRVLPEYDLLRYVATRAELRSTRVLAYPRHLRLYGGKSTFYHMWLNPPHPIVIAGERMTVNESTRIVEALRRHSVDYLILTFDSDYCCVPEFAGALCDPEFLEKHFSLIMTREGWYHRRVCLYRIRTEPGVPEECESDPRGE